MAKFLVTSMNFNMHLDVQEDEMISCYGELLVLPLDECEEEDNSFCVGTLRATIIPWHCNETMAMYAEERDVFDVWELLGGKNFEEKSCGYDGHFEATGDVLLITKLRVKPEFRGFNLGLNLLYESCRHFGRGCAGAIMLPCPLDEDDVKKREIGRKKLQQYYRQLGFKRFKRSNYFSFDFACDMDKPKINSEICIDCESQRSSKQ